MERLKLLTFAVIGLLLLNIGTIGFLFINAPKNHLPPMDRMNSKSIIIEKLHFDKNQQKEYEKLINWHKNEIGKYDENIKNAKNELYKLLSEKDININKKDSLIDLISSNQKQIVETHFKHFDDIKKLCHKDQIEYFDELTEELGSIFAPNKHQNQPRRRDD